MKMPKSMPVLGAALLASLVGGCRRKPAPPVDAPAAPVAAPVAPAAEVAAEPAVEAPPINAPVAGPAPDLDDRMIISADAGTVNGHPDGPPAAAMNKVLQAALPKLEVCLNDAKELEVGKAYQIKVDYRVGNDGKTADVKIAGPVSAAAQRCLSQQLEALAYPSFGGPPVEHSFPLNYKRK